MSNVLDKILANACLDDRIPDGIFDMSNNTHMEVLREGLSETLGLNFQETTEIHNRMVEGKYPERQAYNKDGLLVTFPTPQHKQKAIQRGTHFEQNPVKGQQNVFGGGGQQPPGQQPPVPAIPAAPEAPQQNIFPGGNQQAGPTGSPAPTGQSSPSQLPASETPPSPSPEGQATPSQLPASETPPAPPQQPVPKKTPPPAQQPTIPASSMTKQKTPEERAAEEKVVKDMMGDSNATIDLQPPIAEQLRRIESLLNELLKENRKK